MNSSSMRRCVRLLILTAALLPGAGITHEATTRPGADKTRLPIGDGKISDRPRQGYVWSCQTRFGGGGAHASGDWLRSDGTYDFSAKPIVEGAVMWPGSIRIEVVGDRRVITSNDLPSHATGVFPVARNSLAYQFDRNPNSIREKDFRLSLPKDPQLADPSCVSLGPIGFLVTGSVFFNALDAPGKDAVAHEIQDACQGHPERDGSYHYHSLTTCLEPDRATRTHSALVGYALDGFGIFGRNGEGGALLTNADLDECHGHTHEIDWDGQRRAMYHYHATWEYPYTLGCYRGAPQRVDGVRGARP